MTFIRISYGAGATKTNDVVAWAQLQLVSYHQPGGSICRIKNVDKNKCVARGATTDTNHVADRQRHARPWYDYIR